MSLFFSSCWNLYVCVNDTTYLYLTDEQKAEIRQFSDPPLPDTVERYVTEITAKDLYTSFGNNKYTWTYLWVPGCGSENCKPLFYYDNIIKTQEHKGLQLFLISNTYSYKSVKKRMAGFSGTVYVLKFARYGHKTGKNSRLFGQEMMNAGYLKDAYFGGHMVYKGDSLIYNGSAMSNAIMDSVLAANP